jgi:hypothetical protein
MQDQNRSIPLWMRIGCAIAAIAVVVALPALISSSWAQAIAPLGAGLLAAYVAVAGRIPFKSSHTDSGRSP